jgi:predicted DNA-binding transcriptional regulator YafY
MKADRLLSALLLLQARGRMTGRELSELLEVSQRTVHRDMEALSVAKVPITAIRGSQGGWQLESGWRTQVPGLDSAELSALLMSQPRALGEPGLVAAAERAFAKLMAALPGRMREQAAAMRERLHVDATGWRPSTEDLSMLPIVQDAVARNCKLTFDYTRADGQKAPRTVDPLGIVSKGSSWYLVGRAPNGLRTYRVSRMQSVTALATIFERPANFDLAVFWKSSTTQLLQQRQRYEAILSLELKAAHSISTWCSTCPLAGKSDAPEGWTTLQVEFENEDQARFVVLGLGSRARVEAPPALRDSIKVEAKVILERYEPSTPPATASGRARPHNKTNRQG